MFHTLNWTRKNSDIFEASSNPGLHGSRNHEKPLLRLQVLHAYRTSDDVERASSNGFGDHSAVHFAKRRAARFHILRWRTAFGEISHGYHMVITCYHMVITCYHMVIACYHSIILCVTSCFWCNLYIPSNSRQSKGNILPCYFIAGSVWTFRFRVALPPQPKKRCCDKLRGGLSLHMLYIQHSCGTGRCS